MDSKLSERLQLDSDLTPEKAVTTVRQTKMVNQQQSTIREDSVKEPSIGATTPRKSVPPGVNLVLTRNHHYSQEVPHNLQCPAHIVGYFHYMISKPAQQKMWYVESVRNVAITRGSADLFKLPWYLNSRSTNSRRIVILTMPYWEQLGDVILIANMEH